MIVRHTEHVIESSAREIPNSHNWAATVLVSWDREGQRNVHEFYGPVDGFATQKDSESWGVEFINLKRQTIKLPNSNRQ